MRNNVNRGRAATGFISACLLVLATAAPSYSFDEVYGVDPPAGCGSNCGNTTQQTVIGGSATDGVIDGTSSSSSYQLQYMVPADGFYSGTYMIQITKPDGTVTVITGTIADYSGGPGTFIYGGAPPIPDGQSASLTINESNSRGNSFTAYITLRCWHC